MTWAQWLFEYAGLKEREKAESERMGEVMNISLRSIREIMVGVLGLGVFVPEKAREAHAAKIEAARAAGEDLPLSPFIPAAMMFSNHHLLAKLHEIQEEESKTEAAMADEAFEQMSAALARGDVGDLDPILLGTPGETAENTYWQSFEAQEALRRIGVQRRLETAPPAPHNTVRIKRRGVSFDHG